MFYQKINTQNIMLGGCLPAFVQSPGRNPWRLIHLNKLFFYTFNYNCKLRH